MCNRVFSFNLMLVSHNSIRYLPRWRGVTQAVIGFNCHGLGMPLASSTAWRRPRKQSFNHTRLLITSSVFGFARDGMSHH